MSLPALVQTKAELTRLAIGGLSAGSKRLPKLTTALEQAGAPVFSRLARQLRALTAAPQASELIAAFSRSRAILSTQHRPARKGALQPLPERAAGQKSGRFSGQLVYALRAALRKRGPGRMELFEPSDDPAKRDSVEAALAELRLRWLLPAALGDSFEVAEFIQGRLIS